MRETNERLTTEPVHLIAHTINRAGRVKAFVQDDGNLRIVTRTCAKAVIEISRACHALGIKETAIQAFEVRFTGTQNVLTYPMVFDPMRSGIDRRTGAFL